MGTQPETGPPVIDYEAVGKRFVRNIVRVIALVVVVSIGLALTGNATGPRIGTVAAIAVAVIIVADIVIVGGAALRGMLAAGERGDRLALSDVGLLPPRKRRWLHEQLEASGSERVDDR